MDKSAKKVIKNKEMKYVTFPKTALMAVLIAVSSFACPL
jgi:hypothetical protein